MFEPEQVLQYVEEPDAVRSHEQLVRDYLEVCIKTFHMSVRVTKLYLLFNFHFIGAIEII